MIPFGEFERKCAVFDVVPLVRTMLADMHTPVSAYLRLRDDTTPSFLLESVEANEKIGRFSFVGTAPRVVLRARGETVEIRENGTVREVPGDIFSVLDRLSGDFRQAPDVLAPAFSGGFVGYLGYDNVRHIERLALPSARDGDEDDAVFGLFESIVCFDHRDHLITIVVNVVVDKTLPLREQYERGAQKLEAIQLRLRGGAVASNNFAVGGAPTVTEQDIDRFCASVSRAKEYIVEGDIFQVVLSRRMTLPYTGDPFPVYRALRIINPSPYLFFLDFGGTKLIGSSPEVLVRVRDGIVEVIPIAGTRRRGETVEEDRDLEQELLHDEKEVAEHVMLVDLGRNDVGRISEFGSVSVPVLKRVDRYSHVMHIVSEVCGKLRPGATSIQALRACFPAGTVSGAPKVRAMEIIQELEGKRRGVYAGAVGYVGFNGALDTCIAIRTIVAHRGNLSVQVGAGIVADSVPEREYQETVNKSRALLDAIERAADGLSEIAGKTRRETRP